MNLRWRLTAVIGGTVALMVAGASLLAYVSADRELNRQVDEFLLSRAREAEQTFRTLDLGSPTINDAFQVGALTRPDASMQVVQRSGGSVVVVSGPPMAVQQSDVDIAQRPLDGQRVFDLSDRTIEGTRYRVLTSSVDSGALMVGRSVAEVDQTLTGLRGWLIAISVFGSLAAAIVGWLVADRVLRPVSRLAEATKQVAETRRFDADLPVDTGDELGALATSFNSMLTNLRASREQQQRLVRDASHELRTPLTSLRTNVDLLRRRWEQLPEAERAQVMEDMDGEIRELTDLTSELVESATESETLTPRDFEPIMLIDIVRRVAERTARRSGRSVTIDDQDPGWIRGDHRGLERAIGNLMGNAVKFSPDGSAIEVVVRSNEISVCDRGPGIPESERERVFDRFYRSDTTRTLQGSGLGLAIVADVAAAHGGHAFARPRTGGGAVVGFTIGSDFLVQPAGDRQEDPVTS